MASSFSSGTTAVLYPFLCNLVNVGSFVNAKLSATDNNYSVWAAQMKCLVRSQELTGHIDGSTTAPPDGEQSAEEYKQWSRTDALVKGWILGSLSQEVAVKVLGSDTAEEIWSELSNMFSGNKSVLDKVYPEPPSNVSVGNFVSVKLSNDGRNYLVWKDQIVSLLESQGLMEDFINEEHGGSDEMGRRTDRVVRGWMLSTLSEPLLPSFVTRSTAKEVWDDLQVWFKSTEDQDSDGKEETAKAYPEAPLNVNVGNFVSVKLSEDGDNYQVWKDQMISLIESQGLMEDFINEEHGGSDEMGRRPDRLFRGWMLSTVSEPLLPSLVKRSTAKKVWKHLEERFKSSTGEGSDSDEEEEEETDIDIIVRKGREYSFDDEPSWCKPLYKALIAGDWEITQNILIQHPEALKTGLTKDGDTPLVVALGAGRDLSFITNLVEHTPPDALTVTDDDDYTALHLAVIYGDIEAAKLLAGRNSELPRIRLSDEDLLPVQMAALTGQREMVSYLLPLTHPLNPYTSASLLRRLEKCLLYGIYDFSVRVLEENKDVDMEPDVIKTCLQRIAQRPSAFPSGTELSILQKLIYSCVPEELVRVPQNLQQDEIISASCLSRTPFSRALKHVRLMTWKALEKLVPPVKHIRKQKTMHYQVNKILELLCWKIKHLDDERVKATLVKSPFLVAAKNGISEIVTTILELFPSAVVFKNEKGHDILHLSIMFRHSSIFKILRQRKGELFSEIRGEDDEDYSKLHLVAQKPQQHQLDRKHGVILQMQHELQWYQEIEKFVIDVRKKDREKKTPLEIFNEEHRELLENETQWMMSMANSCTVAASLIATVAFAAAITVPGGNNGNGLPMFSEKKAFAVFAISDAFSLLTSITTVLSFLSIFTSKYGANDFLYSLPKRLITGLISLFLSVTSIMVAFAATIYIVFAKQNSSIIAPIVAFAFIPVILFAYMQLPPLINMIKSTYGPSIFE